MKYVREKKACAVCGDGHQKVLYEWDANEYPHDQYETCSWDGRQSLALTIVKCKACGHIYTSPAFKECALGLVYPEDLVPTDDETIHQDLESKKYIQFAELIRKYIAGTSVVCDIGSRYGGLPYRLVRSGITALGIEYNPESVRMGREFGAPVFQGTVEQMSKVIRESGYSSVDVVTMDDVSEHLSQPDKDFRTVFDALPPGGMLITRQMNISSLGHQLYGRNWYYLQPAAHINYFSPQTLGRLLTQIGFHIVSVDTPHTLPVMLHTIRRSFREICRAFLRNITKERCKRAQKFTHTAGTKLVYLIDRKKTLDDCFTMICRKPD